MGAVAVAAVVVEAVEVVRGLEVVAGTVVDDEGGAGVLVVLGVVVVGGVPPQAPSSSAKTSGTGPGICFIGPSCRLWPWARQGRKSPHPGCLHFDWRPLLAGAIQCESSPTRPWAGRPR